MTAYLPYTGIGSRETPSDVLTLMTALGAALGSLGYTLRSGAAQGADTAFEIGARSVKASTEIFLPWRRFNNHPSSTFGASKTAHEIAARFHPAWDRCSRGARALHARNTHQVLGLSCNHPSLFVLCWTIGGTGQGGTGQALRIARHHGIPIYDFGDPRIAERASKHTPEELARCLADKHNGE